MIEFKISEDIIPGESLGGIILRTPLADLQDDLMELWTRMLPSKFYELSSIFEAHYTVSDGAIEFSVDVRNGKIFKICAMEGYKGKLFRNLYVGMIVSDAFSVEPRLYYDEAEEVLFIRGVEGVSLDVPVIDPDPDEVPSMRISTICVHIPELMDESAQQGVWE